MCVHACVCDSVYAVCVFIILVASFHCRASHEFPPLLLTLDVQIVLVGSDIQKLHELIPPENLPEELGGHLGPYDGKAWADTVTRWHGHSVSSPTLGLRAAVNSTESVCSTAQTEFATDVQSLRSEVLEDSSSQSRLREGSDSSAEYFYDCDDKASWVVREEEQKPSVHESNWDARCKSYSEPSLLQSQQASSSISGKRTKSRLVTTV